jgi:hypothetical protein
VFQATSHIAIDPASPKRIMRRCLRMIYPSPSLLRRAARSEGKTVGYPPIAPQSVRVRRIVGTEPFGALSGESDRSFSFVS